MPYFRLDTNVANSKIKPDFLKTTSKLIASTLDKPESYVLVQLNAGQNLTFGGSNDPAAFAMLMTVGKLGIEENKKHAHLIYEHVSKNLGIPKDRFYVQFIDALPSTVGYNGTTFHPLLGNN